LPSKTASQISKWYILFAFAFKQKIVSLILFV
jgi:hypothetical protein